MKDHGANKDAKIYVGRSTTVHNHLLCVHTLCMNYVVQFLNHFFLLLWSGKFPLHFFYSSREQERNCVAKRDGHVLLSLRCD